MSDLKLWSRVQGNCEKYGGGYVRRGCCKKPSADLIALGCRDYAEKPEPIAYNVDALIEAAEAWITNNAEYYARLGDYRRQATSENWSSYWKADAVQSASYDGLSAVCKAVGADREAVVAVVKCFRRYSQYRTGWNFVAEWHMHEQERAGFRRCVQA